MSKEILSFLVLFVFCAHTSAQRYITYEQFGAIGDGKHDDHEAIVAAHAAANERHLPIKATNGKTYYIGKGAQVAVIKTDVDFGKAKFVIDDVETESYGQPIFRVESYQNPYKVEGIKTLNKGQTNLGVTLPCKSLVHVCNSQQKIYIRMGLNQNNGTMQQEVLKVDSNGNIDSKAPVVWDYSKVTNATAYPIDEKPLTIKGGIFTTIANQANSEYNYRGRGFVVQRSNVRIQNVKHYVIGELDHGAPYAGFLLLRLCADVVVNHCLLTAHKTYMTIGSAQKPVSMGSYDIQAGHCINIRLEHGRQTTNIDDKRYWGLFASNFCKDLHMNDMIISRFDAHMGVANVTLTNCKFGHMGTQMVGFGTMLMKNCEVRRKYFNVLRDDYGSSWDGNYVIKNCTFKPQEKNIKNIEIIHGANAGIHDFGYKCCLPHHIEIDGLLIDDSAVTSPDYEGPCIFGTFNRDVSTKLPHSYEPPHTVSLRNVKVKSGKTLKLSNNVLLFKNTIVTNGINK